MESPRVGLGTGTVIIEKTHDRQSARPRSFEDALRSGAASLLQGAEVATGVLGGPVLSAAVRGMRREVELGASRGMTMTTQGQSPNGSDGLGTVRELQRESHDYNVDLLLLQESTQRENREFQTISNTLKALHDTAKAAISNLHA